MRLIALLEYAAVIIGAIGTVAAQFFALPKGFSLGVFVGGAGCALAGIDALFTQRMCFRASDDAHEDYAGAPALIVGMMVLAIGAAMIASAYLLDNDQWHATVQYLTRRPAPLLAVGGLFVVGIGVLMMLNPQGRSGWLWRILVYFPRSLLGLVVVAAGIAVIGLGAWEWLEPQASHAFLKTLPRKLDELRLRVSGA